MTLNISIEGQCRHDKSRDIMCNITYDDTRGIEKGVESRPWLLKYFSIHLTRISESSHN